MKQPKKILRLVEIKQQAVDRAESSFVAAHARANAASEALARAEADWHEAVTAKASELATISDLEVRDLRIRGLHRVAEGAQRALFLARTEEATMRDALTNARIDLRRFEMWLERTREEQAAEARRLERTAEDERAGRRNVA